ncbi:hypothetical protein VTL71DRAFT_15418 [Oculimacula yallundae]|uniref:histidine kinase n=1 Tax=Oculimacula yallundae TaxID=86028 RepID=A0ABR4CGJ3_9HELO
MITNSGHTAFARIFAEMDNRIQMNTTAFVQDTAACLPTSETTGTTLDRQIRERRRVKELLRYFQPFEVPVRSEGKPVIGSDITLTALAQLATLRLGCQRSFISLIDNTKQYILAEATQTVSLVSEDVYEKENDELSFGQTVLDFATGVCPGTLACFTSLDSSMDVSSTYLKTSRSYYVMNDMSMLEGYAGRSYVRGWPYMRFYAEVPIRSPSGTCIGTICVVDNKGREGLDMRGIRILGEIANTVMDHLELCVSKIQQNQAERMIAGLGQFIEGRASVYESSTRTRARDIKQELLSAKEQAENELGSESEILSIKGPENLWSTVRSSQDIHASENTAGTGIAQEAERGPRPRLFHNESTFSATTANTTSLSTPATEDFPGSPFALAEEQSVENSTTNLASTPKGAAGKMPGSETDDSFDVPNQPLKSVEAIMFRAANLIREAVELDGVAFFDPRSADGRLLTDPLASDEGTSKQSMALDDSTNQEHQEVSRDSSQLPSKIMSCSPKRMPDHSDDIAMSEEILRTLLKQFPSGGLVTFDSQGMVGAESLTSLVGVSRSPSIFHQDSFAFDNTEISGEALLHIFPGITSLMIYSFRDSMRDQCVAHCIAWTSDPARVLRRQDFTYIASFSNSVIAELSRIEAIAADKAKSTFISSISHELRSPLHGIMASMEILRDLTFDAAFQELFGTIESCGSTLLDTIDNVLAFSQSSKHSTEQGGKLLSNPLQSANAPDSAVDLETLVEDVTSICLSGVQFRMIADGSAGPKPKYGAKDSSKWEGVVVICDLSPGDWLFKTNAAVWKRVILNLVGNALKYTSSGTIVVELRQEIMEEETPGALSETSVQRSPSIERSSKTHSTLTRKRSKTISNVHSNGPRRVVRLSVKDSGKGMSQDYLANYLFKPFHQENPLAPGTGLGLSIVERLIHSIGGKLNVTSEEGVGTEIVAEVPMSPPRGHLVKSSSQLLSIPIANLGILSLNPIEDSVGTATGILPSDSKALVALSSAITRYAAASNLVPTSVDSIDSSSADILFIQDSQYRLLDISRILALRKPVIVLCKEPLRTHEYASTKPTNVVLLSNPFGPRKFQQAIDACLDLRRRLLETDLVIHIPNARGQPLTHRSRTATPTPDNSGIMSSSIGQVKEAGPSLLLVEDNPINLKLLVTSIKRLGLPFTTATNGIEAVEAYKSSSMQILLIFMDVQMPLMDGIEASRQIRAHEKQNDLPRSVIVALTALDSPDAKQAALDSGVDMFFTKPVSVKKLKELVMQHYNSSDISSPTSGTG